MFGLALHSFMRFLSLLSLSLCTLVDKIIYVSLILVFIGLSYCDRRTNMAL